MIGDGMGITQITAGMYRNDNQIALERLPIVGLHKTYAYDNLITDSAAGATAFSAGVKTYNGAIGVDPDTLPVTTILEEAEAEGLATGLVSTSSIVHATPASFAAHVKQRKMYEAIALDLVDSGVDLLIGGGKQFFDRRSDERDLYRTFRDRDYVVSDYFQEDLSTLRIDPQKNLLYLTADKEPLPKAQGRDYLADASRLAIDYLQQRGSANGFFLMIEGSQIDWGGHANDSEYIISEMLDFNRAVTQVMDWAEVDGETLVVITADHETGGYAINPGSSRDTIIGRFTSDYHTATMVPVFAYGPGSEQFAGIYENTAIHTKMRRALGFIPVK